MLAGGRKKRRARAEGSIGPDGLEQLDLDLGDMMDADSPELDPFTGMPLGVVDDGECVCVCVCVRARCDREIGLGYSSSWGRRTSRMLIRSVRRKCERKGVSDKEGGKA